MLAKLDLILNSVYRQLSESTVIMVKEVSQLFPRFTRDTRDDYDTYKKKFDSAIDKTVIAQDSLASMHRLFLKTYTINSMRQKENAKNKQKTLLIFA